MIVSQGEHHHSRAPVRAAAIQTLLEPHTWRVATVLQTGSTNSDLAAAAAEGAPDGSVLIAQEQINGKGRLGRTWTAPAGSGLTMSILLRVPQVRLPRRGWIGAILGLAVVHACREVAGVEAQLKWPNDMLVGEAKCAGILAELAGDALIVGVGLNVSLRTEELPRADATSLELAGAVTLDREMLAVGILNRFGELVQRWRSAEGDPQRSGIRSAYLAACGTIGAAVRVDLPSGDVVLGTAIDVAMSGELLVRTRDGDIRSFSAADVKHLRRSD